MSREPSGNPGAIPNSALTRWRSSAHGLHLLLLLLFLLLHRRASSSAGVPQGVFGEGRARDPTDAPLLNEALNVLVVLEGVRLVLQVVHARVQVAPVLRVRLGLLLLVVDQIVRVVLVLLLPISDREPTRPDRSHPPQPRHVSSDPQNLLYSLAVRSEERRG